LTDRIGVFICECGPNIGDRVDLSALVGFARELEPVRWAQPVGLLCSPEARRQVADVIRRKNLTHLVFAGCSPREHERTLQSILEEAGLNPFLMQVANIREQCAWVIGDRDRATGKAKALIRAAVQRVRRHEPLTIREIEVRPDVLVVGAGMAGIAAARTLAQDGRRVYLVERSGCIGGRAARYEALFPDQNCAACLIAPELDAVLHDPGIEVLTLSEVESIRGAAGNFVVTIKDLPRFIDARRCIGCGACVDVCPVKIPNETGAPMAPRSAVSIPYPGALPHLAAIDRPHCRRFNGDPCSACRDACPFEAVDFDQTGVSRELSVGAVVIAAGFKSFDPRRDNRYGQPGMENVLDADTFEGLVNPGGPSGGKIVTAGGRPPDSIAIVHCVGSRSEDFNAYCSGVCCRSAIKHGWQVKEQLPASVVHHLFSDLCLPGAAAQRFFDRYRARPGVVFHRLDRPDALRIAREDGLTRIRFTNASGRVETVDAQLVILATAIEPSEESRQLAKIFDIELDEDGFFKVPRPMDAPQGASREGIHLAGCCRGPVDIPTAVVQGQAAAGCILQKLIPGAKIALEPIAASVDPKTCSGCRICSDLCPCGAIVQGAGETTATVSATLCRGCGTCAAGCPAGAIRLRHFSGAAVAAEIEGLLKPDGD
jgi:heterodisulfide reductase subunit A